MNLVLSMVLSQMAGTQVLDAQPDVAVWGAQLAPRLEPFMLWQGRAQLSLTTRQTRRPVDATTGSLAATGCATATAWSVVVPARIAGEWHVVEFLERGERGLPLPAAPVSAVAFDGDCQAAIALADGRVVRWGFDDKATVAPLGSAVVDPAEAGAGVLLVAAGGTLFRGGTDATLTRPAEPTVTLDGRALTGAVWVAPLRALLVLTTRGSLYLVPPHGAATRLVAGSASTRSGLVVWGDDVAWASTDGLVHAFSAVDGVRTLTQLGEPMAALPLTVLDFVDEGRPQLGVVSASGRLALLHASGAVEWLPLGARPIAAPVIDARDDAAVLVWVQATADSHQGLRLGASSRPVFLEGAVPAGQLTARGLGLPTLDRWPNPPDAVATSLPGDSEGWSCGVTPGGAWVILVALLWVRNRRGSR